MRAYFRAARARAPLITFTSGTQWDVTAVIQADLNGSVYDITSISGTVVDQGNSYSIAALMPVSSSPNFAYARNNVITTTGGAAPFGLTSTGGIAFTSTDRSGYGPGDPNGTDPSFPLSEFNIYLNGTNGTLLTSAAFGARTN